MRGKVSGSYRTLVLLLAAGARLFAGAAAAAAQDRLSVLAEAGTPMVAMEVLLATGPAHEDTAQAGVSYLAARSIVDPIRNALDAMGASVGVQVHKDAVAFSLLAAPDAWQEASRALLVALFRDPVENAAVERERRAIRTELEGRTANPADALARTVDEAFWGPRHPWGRSPVGTLQTVQRLTLAEVDAFLREHFTPSRTYIVVVGPVAAGEVADHLLPFLGDAPAARQVIAPAAPLESPVLRDYNSITTWISASYPIPDGADVEALRLLTHLVTEAISFGPRRPSVYDARGDLFMRAGGGGEVRFQLVVPPREAEDWARRIQEAVAQLAIRPLAEGEFEESSRSYRGTRLLELNSPEARARELARRLYLNQPLTKVTEFEEMSRTRLHAAARSLHSPVVVILGPAITRGE
ncbi:hypothetical protein BH23GEM3_BH23GEM3_07850 [soil metagenome]